MTWFEWKNKIIENYKVKAPMLGVEQDNIIYGGQVQIPPCLNIHISSAGFDDGRVTTGASMAGKMDINVIVTVPGSMNDADTQDEAMRIAIEVAKYKPNGVHFVALQPVHIFDGSGHITDTCAMSIQFYCLYGIWE